MKEGRRGRIGVWEGGRWMQELCCWRWSRQGCELSCRIISWWEEWRTLSMCGGEGCLVHSGWGGGFIAEVVNRVFSIFILGLFLV